jgi:hypothetical protein
VQLNLVGKMVLIVGNHSFCRTFFNHTKQPDCEPVMFNMFKPIKPHEAMLCVVKQFALTYSGSRVLTSGKRTCSKVTSVQKFILSHRDNNGSGKVALVNLK